MDRRRFIRSVAAAGAGATLAVSHRVACAEAEVAATTKRFSQQRWALGAAYHGAETQSARAKGSGIRLLRLPGRSFVAPPKTRADRRINKCQEARRDTRNVG